MSAASEKVREFFERLSRPPGGPLALGTSNHFLENVQTVLDERDSLLVACEALLASGWHKTHCPAFPPGGDEADCDCGWACAVDGAEDGLRKARAK